MAQGIYNRLKYNWMVKAVSLTADSIQMLLLNNSHTFNPDHNVLTDINTNEITGTGYTAGGVALTTQTVVQDDTNDLAYFDADDVVWTTSTFTAYHAVLNDITASNNLISSFDFGGAKSVTAGTFTVRFATAGVLKIT